MTKSKAITKVGEGLNSLATAAGSMQWKAAGYLERGWVIANHKLVSFHAAFISSILNISAETAKGEKFMWLDKVFPNIPEALKPKFAVLEFVFASWETLISLFILYMSWHIAIAVHEMGHYLTAAKLTALNKDSQEEADRTLKGGGAFGFYIKMFLLIPWGKFSGVKKDEGNYAADAPYNLAVAAAAPVWSQWLATIFLPAALILIAVGLKTNNDMLIYLGRFFLAPGCVALLDRFEADRGKLKEFRTREAQAAEQAARASAMAGAAENWYNQAGTVKKQLLSSRMLEVALPNGSKVRAPWQYRNCAMGGRHTEKEYPESNISMQEGMFIPLSAKTYEEAQEMTVKLQTRLKEIIESAPGAKVMGVGLEGGIAPYVDKEPQDRVPEQRMWRLMKQAILDCEYVPGKDVAIALDPACSELENAYREETGQKDSVGMYRFWRDKSKVDMSRDQILDLYKEAMRNGVPILSIEDGFGEMDHAGWKLLMEGDKATKRDGLGDKVFIIGDDLVTTKDTNIERCAKNGEINATLIKANQIGTLSETVLAMLASLAYDSELVVSHRSKSPNDPFEAEISTAMNALGLKCGGGANTERLQKYGRVVQILALAERGNRPMTADERKLVEKTMQEIAALLTGQKDVSVAKNVAEIDIAALLMRMLAIESVIGNEEPTNAGIPTAAATLMLGKTGTIRFTGSTPLGTSAGVDEAIHYIDSIVMPGPLTKKYPDLFKEQPDKTFRFKKGLKFDELKAKNDQDLMALWKKSRRYEGKGCMDAVNHIETVLGKAFVGKRLTDLGNLLDVDRTLLKLEFDEAVKVGFTSTNASKDDKIQVMQRKGVLGMNAILSMSVAMGRAVAAAQGKEMWQLIRQIATDAMAKFIVANGKDKKDVATLTAMDFDKLQTLFRETARQVRSQGKAIAPLLRDQLPVYPV
jgi:enolase